MPTSSGGRFYFSSTPSSSSYSANRSSSSSSSSSSGNKADQKMGNERKTQIDDDDDDDDDDEPGAARERAEGEQEEENEEGEEDASNAAPEFDANPFCHYNVLQISRYSSEEVIKKSFRDLSKIYHPDKAKNSEEAEENAAKFRAIEEARACLLDKQLRVAYDKNREKVVRAKENEFRRQRGEELLPEIEGEEDDALEGMDINLEDLLNMMFGFGGGRGGGRGRARHFHSHADDDEDEGEYGEEEEEEEAEDEEDAEIQQQEDEPLTSLQDLMRTKPHEGFGHDKMSFYNVYQEALTRILQIERDAYEVYANQSSHASRPPPSYPSSFGSSDTNPATVLNFYAQWQKFSTFRSFHVPSRVYRHAHPLIPYQQVAQEYIYQRRAVYNSSVLRLIATLKRLDPRLVEVVNLRRQQVQEENLQRARDLIAQQEKARNCKPRVVRSGNRKKGKGKKKK